MKRRSQPPITGTAQNIDEKRQERIERIAKELSKERTALELATGIDLASHVLFGEDAAKAATDALATAATKANVERTALEIATGIELSDHALTGIEKQKVIDAAAATTAANTATAAAETAEAAKWQNMLPTEAAKLINKFTTPYEKIPLSIFGIIIIIIIIILFAIFGD